jgi:hypothetical protein
VPLLNPHRPPPLNLLILPYKPHIPLLPLPKDLNSTHKYPHQPLHTNTLIALQINHSQYLILPIQPLPQYHYSRDPIYRHNLIGNIDLFTVLSNAYCLEINVDKGSNFGITEEIVDDFLVMGEVGFLEVE